MSDQSSMNEITQKTKKEPKKPFYVEIMEELSQQVSTIVESHPEVGSVVLSVDWVVGKDEIPPGRLIINSASAMPTAQHEVLVSQVTQMSKIQTQLAGQLAVTVSNYGKAITKLSEQLKETEQKTHARSDDDAGSKSKDG